MSIMVHRKTMGCVRHSHRAQLFVRFFCLSPWCYVPRPDLSAVRWGAVPGKSPGCAVPSFLLARTVAHTTGHVAPSTCESVGEGCSPCEDVRCHSIMIVRTSHTLISGFSVACDSLANVRLCKRTKPKQHQVMSVMLQ
jgi:hypothetical protein